MVIDFVHQQIISDNRGQPARNPHTRFFDFHMFFGRGLQARMEVENEAMYLKIWEVEIEW